VDKGSSVRIGATVVYVIGASMRYATNTQDAVVGIALDIGLTLASLFTLEAENGQAIPSRNTRLAISGTNPNKTPNFNLRY